MKKHILFSFFFAIITQFSIAQNYQSTDVTGEWLTATKDGKILIYKDGNKFYGKIIWGKAEGRKDINNPKESLRSRDLIGLIILKDFVFNGKNKWTDGEIYDPNNGKKYSCTITLKNPKTLEVRGYIGISLFGRTEVWTRQ